MYLLWGKIKYCLFEYPNSTFSFKKMCTLFFVEMKSDIFVDAFFTFGYLFCFLSSVYLFIVCLPSFCPTEFLF